MLLVNIGVTTKNIMNKNGAKITLEYVDENGLQVTMTIQNPHNKEQDLIQSYCLDFLKMIGIEGYDN